MFRPTLISKDSTEETLKRHSLQKIEEKPLPKSLSRDISLAKKSENTCQRKNVRREISAKKIEETSPPKYLQTNNHNKKHGKNQN